MKFYIWFKQILFHCRKYTISSPYPIQTPLIIKTAYVISDFFGKTGKPNLGVLPSSSSGWYCYLEISFSYLFFFTHWQLFMTHHAYSSTEKGFQMKPDFHNSKLSHRKHQMRPNVAQRLHINQGKWEIVSGENKFFKTEGIAEFYQFVNWRRQGRKC